MGPRSATFHRWETYRWLVAAAVACSASAHRLRSDRAGLELPAFQSTDHTRFTHPRADRHCWRNWSAVRSPIGKNGTRGIRFAVARRLHVSMNELPTTTTQGCRHGGQLFSLEVR